MEHPIEGKQEILVPKTGCCVPCLETASEGFAFVPREQLFEAVAQEGNMLRKFFFEARANRGAATRDTWGEQSVLKKQLQLNDVFIDYDGLLLGEFMKRNMGVHPDDMGIPPIDQTNPITHETQQVYLSPSDTGATYKYRFRLTEAAEWTVGCMPQQLFSAQGETTMQHLAQQMRLQSQCKNILMNRVEFNEMLAGAKTSQGNNSKASSFSTHGASGGQAWTTAVSSGQTSNPILLKCRRPQPSAAQTCQQKTGPADVSALLARFAAKPVAKPVASQTPSAAGPKPLELRRARSSSTMQPHTAQAAKRPPSDACSVGSGSSPKAPRLRPCPNSVVSQQPRPAVVNFTQRLPVSATGLKPGQASAVSSPKSVTDSHAADLEMRALTPDGADKFAVAKVRCHATIALRGKNMRADIINLRKKITEAANNGVEVEGLNETASICEDCESIIWPRILGLPWATVVAKVKNIIKSPFSVINELPAENWCSVSGRFAATHGPPAVKQMDLVKFWKAICVHQNRPKESAKLGEPSIWVNRLTEEDLELQGCRTFHNVVVDILLVPPMKRGKQGRDALLEYAEMVIKKIDAYPQHLRDRLAPCRQKCQLVFLLQGTFPFMHGSKIQILEEQLKDKACRLVIELKTNPYYKQIADAAWGRNMDEEAAWPQLEQILTEFQKDRKDPCQYAEALLKIYPRIKNGVRHEAVDFAQRAAAHGLHTEVQRFDLRSTLPESENERLVKVLDLIRRSNAYWKSDLFTEALQATADFTATIASKCMKSNMHSGCVAFNGSDQLDSAAFTTLSEAFPTSAGVVIIFEGADECAEVSKCIERISTIVANSYPDHPENAASVGHTFLNKVQCKLDPELELAVDIQKHWDVIQKACQLEALKSAFDSYQGLGDCAQSRVQADGQHRTCSKALVRCYKGVDFTGSVATLALFKNSSALATLASKSLEAIHAYGTSFCSDGRNTLTTLHHSLKPAAKGGADCYSWKAALSDTSKITDVLTTAAATIDRLDAKGFINEIRVLHQDCSGLQHSILWDQCVIRCLASNTQEMLRNKARHEQYLLLPDEDEVKEYDETLKFARVTVTESHLVAALRNVCAEKQVGDASKASVDAQIKAWHLVGITVDDIQSALWCYCQQITHGKVPSDV